MLNIKTDSRKIKNGDTFIAIKGLKSDGHDYIKDAIKNGATKIICEKGNYKVKTVTVKNTRKYLNNYLYNYYYKKISDIKLIGITGTNGKTTSAYLIFQALNELNIKAAYIGTIGFFVEKEKHDLKNTTPELIDIYEMLLYCSEKNIKYVCMEVSSHSLELDRLNKIQFDYAVFTNLTIDHLDFHKTMDSYALAKKKLFLKLHSYGHSIINCDDSYFKKMVVGPSIFYGYESDNYKIIDYKIHNGKMNFKILIRDNTYEFNTCLLGRFNVYNLLITIIILDTMNIDISTIKNVIEKLKPPVGRNYIMNYNDNNIVIDYAHTPDAIEKIIINAKEYTKGKIYSIIGCGGNRDKTKRPIIGNITTTMSDFVIITSDNPRFEKNSNIVKDIIKGIKNDNYKVIQNRKRAIKYGIKKLKKNDTLLILGKGHEIYQIIKNKYKYHNDYEIVIKYIRKE